MKLLKMDDVARILDVTNDRAYALIRAGIIPAVYLGRQVRVEEEQLKEWIKKGGKSITK
ncbi:helix-turn-helix domain-containing protein [Neobacillus niacini]|jgi:excisionase family DNA binding protein|uniref:helix-turn-helix domain-containing protein n=1 Tax=Neobacillus niacini TaxID=86668 RepID=UPI001C8E38CD|nr:helix-turn-helix domain-containing protein [Neobacillus niacini]